MNARNVAIVAMVLVSACATRAERQDQYISEYCAGVAGDQYQECLFYAAHANARDGNTNIAQGLVVAHDSGCDYFQVYTGHGYVLLKQLSGSDSLLGDQLVGDFEKFGVTKVYDFNRKSQLNSRVENYSLNEHSATTIYYQNCD